MKRFPEIITNPHALLFVRMLVAVLLMAAGALKLTDRHTFVEVVRNFRVLPENLVGAMALMIPIVEVFLSLLLILGLLQQWSLIIASSVFILFGLAVAVNLLRGRRNISCGCFGGGRNHRLTWSLVVRNIVLAGLAASAAAGPTTFGNGSEPTLMEAAALMVVAVATFASWRLGGLVLRHWQPTGLPESPTLIRARK